MRRFAAMFLALGLAVTTIACGSNRPVSLPESGATLEGTIKYGTDDIQFAMIIAQTATGSATGKVGPDGKYKLENVPLGEVTVGVNTDAATGDFQSASMAAGSYKGPEAKGKAKVNLKFTKVPAKFFDPATFGLKTTIQKGVNTYDIVIGK